MPRTRDCDFCGDAIEPGTGTMFVRKDGTTIHYCSAKCEKNADLGREARDLEWTAEERPEASQAEEDDEATETVTDEEPAADTTSDEEPADGETAEEADSEPVDDADEEETEAEA
jgi:large subunit ribosomal protein L24e